MSQPSISRVLLAPEGPGAGSTAGRNRRPARHYSNRPTPGQSPGPAPAFQVVNGPAFIAGTIAVEELLKGELRDRVQLRLPGSMPILLAKGACARARARGLLRGPAGCCREGRSWPPAGPG